MEQGLGSDARGNTATLAPVLAGRAEARPDRPPRPLPWVCAVVSAGSLVGSSGWLDTSAWKLGAAGAGALLLVVILLRPAVRRCCLATAVLLLVGTAAGWRGSREALPRDAPDDRGRAAEEGTPPRRGVWTTTGSFSDAERGQLAGGAERFDLIGSRVEDGESVVLLTGDEPREWPRGPEPGPNRISGSAHPATRVLPDEIVRLSAPEPGLAGFVSDRLDALRTRLLARCSSLERPLTRALVKALLFGDMTEMPREVSDLFVRVGTYHVLAISGSQVGLVAILILWPLSRLIASLFRRSSRGRLTLAPELFHVVLLLVFVPIAGSGAPVLRSALSYALGTCAPRAPMRRALGPVRGREIRLGRKADPISLWSLALTFECLLHATAPLSISVQLSYGATLGLMLGTGPILHWLRSLLWSEGRISAVDALGRARASVWRVPGQRGLDLVLCGIAASLAAVLATLPCVWARFGEWSPVGILATPALALPMAWLLALGWLWLVLPWAVPQVLIDLPARAMIGEMQFFDLWPGSPDPLPPRPLALLLLASVLTFASLARARTGSRLEWSTTAARHPPLADGQDRGSTLGRAALSIWMVLLLPWTLAPSQLELWALDVGHGTGVVLRAPGLGTWIFDAGSRDRPDVAREAVLPLLRRWETAELGIVLSHTDRDHSGALPYILERYPPRVWAGALPAQCAERLAHTTLILDVGLGRVELPAWKDRGNDSRLEIWRGSEEASNEGSRSLFIHTDQGSLVLSGDAEGDGLARMLRREGALDRGLEPLRLLLFPHHGSDTDQLGELLARTRPAEIWISCSGTPAVQAEIERRGVRCRTTAADGPLTLDSAPAPARAGDAP